MENEITNETDLNTPYGPGKFETLQDVYFYNFSLDGANDDEAGNSSVATWYGKLNGPFEHPQLKDVVGAIVSEDSQGFVKSITFTDKARFEATWQSILEDVAEFEKEY
jgi:hypothetical protein